MAALQKNIGTLGIEPSRRTGTLRSLRFNHSATLSPTMSQLRHRRGRLAGAPGGRKVCNEAASFATLCALLLCTAWEFLMEKNMTNIRKIQATTFPTGPPFETCS